MTVSRVASPTRATTAVMDEATFRSGRLSTSYIAEVFPDGAATRLTYGILNLTHRDGHDRPAVQRGGIDLRPVAAPIGAVMGFFGEEREPVSKTVRTSVATTLMPVGS